MTTRVIAPGTLAARKYELWRPTIEPRRRLLFERIHHGVAEAWSHAMAGYLPGDQRFEFEALGFEIFSDFNARQAADSRVVVFAIEQARVIGFLILSGAVARTLVDTRLGIKPAADAAASASFTRIEAGVLREAIRALLARLSETYLGLGLGNISGVRDCERLGDTLVFAPEDYLAILRFRIGDQSDDLRVTVALSSNAINAVRDTQHLAASTRGDGELQRLAGQLPVPVDVVLGAWKTSIRELQQLRPGDQIVLPDGEDGWLAAANVRLRIGKIQFAAGQTSIEIKPSVRLR